MSAFRGLAFGDSAEDLWGAAWAPADQTSIALAVRSGAAAQAVEAELSATGEPDPWRLEGDGVSLVMTSAGAAGQGATADAALRSADRLCTVSGEMELAGVRREIACLGWRSVVEVTLDLERIGSFRQTSAWFEPAYGLSLLALRPRKGRGQDSDVTAAAVLEPEPAPGVSDPRLSTTYDAAGHPARAGLELWLEPEEPSPKSDEQQASPPLPRRATGEALGPGVSWSVDEFTLYATLLRWHSRGSEGSGIYLLGERR